MTKLELEAWTDENGRDWERTTLPSGAVILCDVTQGPEIEKAVSNRVLLERIAKKLGVSIERPS